MRSYYPHHELSTVELRQRARRGDATAQLELADRHARGYRAFRDEKQAKRWFQLAAQNGLEHTRVATYWLGIGENQEGKQMLDQLEKLASERGVVSAQILLARIYADLSSFDLKYAALSQKWEEQVMRSARKNLKRSTLGAGSPKVS